MDNFNSFIQRNFKISFVFFALGLFFGIIYSLNLLGIFIDSQTLLPSNMRSIHISLMLYGFVTLMLSYLPFLIINKEVGSCSDGLHYLNLYTIFWYIFLIFMIFSLLFGNTRGLAFYDFPYELNFILALAGVFYIIALFKFIKQYKVLPTWVKVCLKIVIIAPITLLILMNPIIGQVERTISGPHGDNTLGMSLSMIPLYYLIIKLLNKGEFVAKWNIFWIIPTIFYFSSVLYRIFFVPLTYNQEWFLQYLTFLYVPLLYKWYKDTHIEGFAKKALLVSILAFVFVDIEGNILFIPELRWVFHRNDLVVAHAHVAMGIGAFFMVIAMFTQYIKELQKNFFYTVYLLGMLGIFSVLSVSGLSQAGFIDIDILQLWMARTFFGIITFASIIVFIDYKIKATNLQIYNVLGVLNDGLGGVFLILLASFIYPYMQIPFDGKYQYIVFAFVSLTGVIHFMALKYKEHEDILTSLTALIRVFISAVFFSLYSANILGKEALVICVFDLVFALFYVVFLKKGKMLCKDSF
ncbi:hypothetical protein [Sulfurospirillum arcachonense]|uniref:hypothetical protein n=1 Tax=Sulfurospirillum arcachonense TaxID=57666 RepID=UPI000468F29E|nr:hypothetical protein [Sulfurospirillum arcachonense]